MVGTVGSGKSTVAGGIVLTAQTLVHDPRAKFFCRVLENRTNILADASNLRRGRFPVKTPAYQISPPEAGLLMMWRSWLGERKMQIPICDVAGEDIQELIRKVGVPDDPDSYYASTTIINHVINSDGFIVIVPASRALLDTDCQIEEEAANLEVDPDVNLARILSEVVSHKDKSRGKEIKGIAVVITKWDLLAPYAKNMGISFYDEYDNIILENINRFMEISFPATYMELKAAGLPPDKIQYFPSHFQALRNKKGEIQKWPDGSYKIECEFIQNRRVPVYSEKSYVNLFEWLKQFAQ